MVYTVVTGFITCTNQRLVKVVFPVITLKGVGSWVRFQMSYIGRDDERPAG